MPVADYGRIVIHWLRPPGSLDILLVAVHLPSKLHMTEAEQVLTAPQLRAYIDEAERQADHTRTVVLGDLNMNPFEAGVVGADGLHAVMSRLIATRTQRTIQGVERQFFYNPMWSLFGDASLGPPGTYYYDSSGQIEYFWHMFDQVLVRPGLLSRLDDQPVEIVTTIGSRNLLSSRQIPDREVGSDHLPVRFRIDLD